VSLEITCRMCGKSYQPTRDDLIRGPTHYRVCPARRESERKEEP
jgi:hypothetical protein